jgi:hypothetical protein
VEIQPEDMAIRTQVVAISTEAVATIREGVTITIVATGMVETTGIAKNTKRLSGGKIGIMALGMIFLEEIRKQKGNVQQYPIQTESENYLAL